MGRGAFHHLLGIAAASWFASRHTIHALLLLVPLDLRRAGSTSSSVVIVRTPPHPQTHLATARGFLDSLSSFLRSRGGDFIKLDETTDGYGPGPVLILHNVPSGIDDAEIRDMVGDGAPSLLRNRNNNSIGVSAGACCVVVCRLHHNSPELSMSMQEALETILERGRRSATDAAPGVVVVMESGNNPSASVAAAARMDDDDDDVVPVLLFSGFRNNEMLNVYNLLGREIYAEALTGAFPSLTPASAACAKAIPRAMTKPLRQVLSEVADDHRDALRLDTEPEQRNL
jgi:hypothetical protein